MNLWAARWDAAYGWRWHLQRDVDASNQAAWLAVFEKDEPTVRFVVSTKKPRMTPGPKEEGIA